MSGSPVWQNTSSVSGQVTLDMQLKALSAILVSLLGIAAYVWFRFQRLSWGIAAIASLVHDTLVMLAGIGASYYVASALGFLGIQEFKISLTVVAGFLTLIGYSINDTIVIFDRIREMRGKSPFISAQLINDAVNLTLSRTILTGGLTLIVVLILYIFGGEGIHTFAFCMLIGVLSGTYSTVFIAAPLLLWLMKTAPASAPPAKPAAVKQPVSTAGGRT
jgi:SecD/SecF fusion protein